MVFHAFQCFFRKKINKKFDLLPKISLCVFYNITEACWSKDQRPKEQKNVKILEKVAEDIWCKFTTNEGGGVKKNSPQNNQFFQKQREKKVGNRQTHENLCVPFSDY